MIRALARASAAFVGAATVSGAERANLEATLRRMIGALAQRERLLLRSGLIVLDTLSLARFARTFSRLDDAAARRLLDALRRAPLASLRRLHQSVRMMTQLAWYSDAVHWDDCGYDGPWLGRVAIERGPDPDLGSLP